MSRPIAVLRPEPGNRVTAAAIEAAGRRAIRLPLFEARPLAWEVPDPARFDALILTSANAVRHAGPGLAGLAGLPVYAVGEATAAAATRAGLKVASTGAAGSAALLRQAEAAGVRRALHLAARERTIAPGGIVAGIVTVYASEALPIGADEVARLSGSVAMVHSARAAARLAEIADARARIAVAAVSGKAAAALGEGWERVAIAADMSGDALVALALTLAD